MSEIEILQGARSIKATIQNALQTNTGAIIGRFGTIEFEAMNMYEIVARIIHPHYPQVSITLERNAGVWPNDHNTHAKWVTQYHMAAQESDIMAAGWHAPMVERESVWLNTYNRRCMRIPLRSLEPYYVPPSEAWTSILANQKVAVVSSFADTIQKQLQKRNLIWPNVHESYLPSSTTFIPIKTYYSPALANGNLATQWPGHIQNCEEAVNYIAMQVIQSGAKIALLGCGGLAMPIARKLKQHNIISVVMGGSIQVLFGIKGRRWETHSVISRFWNPHWVNPSPHEVPGAANQIEGGCYW